MQVENELLCVPGSWVASLFVLLTDPAWLDTQQCVLIVENEPDPMRAAGFFQGGPG